MTKEDKELLLKDLSARLPYCPICKYHYRYKGVISLTEKEGQEVLSPRMIEEYDLKENITWTNKGYYSELKPYLRPMSDMTEEEKEIISQMVNNHQYGTCSRSGAISDYLNSIHIDYRGLIKKGLALEALEGMYNIKK